MKKAGQKTYVKKVIVLSNTDTEFRNALLADPKQAIDRYKKKLRFGSDKLSQGSLDVLSSITKEELHSLNSIFKKLKNAGYRPGPREMF